jgi:flagellin
MGLTINTNTTSMASQRHLANNSSNLGSSFEKLSSGLRINSAADDAAGMNIATKLTAQVKGLNQAARNVNDASSMLKTAESALAETNNLLQRLRELSVQSGNDTNTAADRQALQSEADQLISEIDRVASQVEYNGQSLLDGTFSSKSFQVGANSGQTLTVSVDSARSSAVGNSHSFTSAGATGTNVAMTTATAGANQGTNGFVDSAALDGTEIKVGGANGNTVNVGASDAADDTVSTAGKATSAIAKAAAINKVSSQTGVTAEATNTHWRAEGGAIAGDAVNSIADGDITINDISITFAGGSALVGANDTDQTLADAINAKTAQTGVTADTSSGTLNLNAADGRNINVAISATSASSGTTVTNIGSAAATTTARGGLSFSSNDVSGNFSLVAQSGTTDMVSVGMGNALAGAGGATNADSSVSSGNEISALQLGSAATSATAVANLDTAIAQVASSRSDIGALLNRLDSASNTLKISSENTSAARSSVQDVDFASETAKFSKNQILQQASSSMLAQANVSGQIALSLLGFG